MRGPFAPRLAPLAQDSVSNRATSISLDRLGICVAGSHPVPTKKTCQRLMLPTGLTREDHIVFEILTTRQQRHSDAAR